MPDTNQGLFMKLRSLSLGRVIRQVLPSVFFILCSLIYILDGYRVRSLFANLITGGIILLLVGNIILQNKILSRILGVLFLLLSFYMLLAVWDDFVDGEASSGYWVYTLIFLFGLVMSILLIWGYNNKKKDRVE